MKYNSNDQRLRYAIYQAYDRKSFYSGQPIQFEELAIDHIIPTSYGERPIEFAAIKKRCGLADDFDFNDLCNVVPCHYKENQHKRDDILPRVDTDLLRSSRKTKKIIQIAITLKKVEKAEVDLIFKINPLINEEKLIAPETAYNFMTGEEHRFSEAKVFNDFIWMPNCYISRERVALLGHPPSVFDRKNKSCMIFMKRLEVRGEGLTFNDSDLEILHDSNHRNRVFANVCRDKNAKQYEQVYFRYGVSNFWLDKHEAIQLYEIIDEFVERCNKIQLDIDNYFGATEFQRSPGLYRYRLCKISKALWDDMKSFGEQFDMDAGRSEWNIFDVYQDKITITNRIETKSLKACVHAIIGIEEVYDSPGADYYLTWDVLQSQASEGYTKDGLWDANTTYDWITMDWLPYMFWHNSKALKSKKAFWQSKSIETFDSFRERFIVSNYIHKL